MIVNIFYPSSLITCTLISTIVMLVIILVIVNFRRAPPVTAVDEIVTRLPGPTGTIATVKLLMSLRKKGARRMFHKTKIYEKIFGFGKGKNTYVIIMDHELLKDAFVTKSDIFSDRGGIIRAMLESVLPAKGSIFNNGAGWHEILGFITRTIKNPDFCTNTVTHCINSAIHRLYSTLDETIDQSFDPKKMYQRFTIDIIHRIAFAKDISCDSDIVTQFIDDLDEVVGQTLNPSSLLLSRPSLISTYLFKGYRSKLQRSAEYVKATAREVFTKEDKASSLVSIFHQYINAIRSSGKASYADPDDGWVIVHNLFFAAADTLHEVLLWITLFLATQQNIQEKLRAEINTLKSDIGGEVSYDYEGRLPRVRSTILEVLRMRPVAPMGVPHVTSEKGTIDGYYIPQGCQLFPNIWGMHNDPDVWKDPSIFNPERFITDTGEVNEERAKLVIPFSIGPRSCPGELVAKRTLFLTTISLVTRYRMSLPAKGPSPKLVNEAHSFTMSPERFKVIFTKIQTHKLDFDDLEFVDAH